MFLDCYAIQNVPSNNINRDESGNPKTAQYGGVLRSRVSSQAWKRAMRAMFADLLPGDRLGVRTKGMVDLLVGRITAMRPDAAEQAPKLAAAIMKAIGVKTSASKRTGSAEGNPETGALVFIGNTELDHLAALALRWLDEGVAIDKPDKTMKQEAKAVFHGPQAVDIALFGRMLAEAPDLNTDASAQVAHAISVDAVTPEYDYYTASDDMADADNAGAAMLDTVGFNSSTLYRYATLDVPALYAQLGDVTATAVAARAFVEAFIRSMPSGKQHAYANRTLPDTCVVVLRQQQPFNAVEAFEDPVTPKSGVSIAAQAGARLMDQIARTQRMYGDGVHGAWVVSTTLDRHPGTEPPFALSVTMPELLEAIEAGLTTLLNQNHKD